MVRDDVSHEYATADVQTLVPALTGRRSQSPAYVKSPFVFCKLRHDTPLLRTIMTPTVTDHSVGLFAPILDHRTNTMLYGAAAREYRLLMNQGVTGYQAAAIAGLLQHIEPLLVRMDVQQQQQQQMLQQQMLMIQHLMRQQGAQDGQPER